MTGHHALIAMRRRGQIPRAVWMTDGDDPRSSDWPLEPNHADQHYHAVISLAPGDMPELLDMRCVVGLEVHLSAERGRERAMRLHASLVDAGARIVVTTTYPGPEMFIHGIKGVPSWL